MRSNSGPIRRSPGYQLRRREQLDLEQRVLAQRKQMSVRDRAAGAEVEDRDEEREKLFRRERGQ